MPDLTPADEARRIDAQTKAAVKRAEWKAELQAKADQPPAEPPVRDGYRRVYYDVPMEPPAPKPVYERVWSYVGNEATKFENFSNLLYRQLHDLNQQLEQMEAAYKHSDPDDTAQVAINIANVRRETESVIYAIEGLFKASSLLRNVRTALAAYVDTDKLERGY